MQRQPGNRAVQQAGVAEPVAELLAAAAPTLLLPDDAGPSSATTGPHRCRRARVAPCHRREDTGARPPRRPLLRICSIAVRSPVVTLAAGAPHRAHAATTPPSPRSASTPHEAVRRDRRGRRRVADDRTGEFFSLLGPSGCGKTTTLRMIGGFDLPTSGRIELRGRDVTRDPPDKRPVNMVFQSYALFPHLDVAGNIAFGLKRRGVEGGEIRRRTGEHPRAGAPARLREAPAARALRRPAAAGRARAGARQRAQRAPARRAARARSTSSSGSASRWS